MSSVIANGITIEYTIEGSGPPLLLVMGLGGQLTDWPQAFVDRLATHFTVIRFDNRDSGLSTIIDEPPPPRSVYLKALFSPKGLRPPYKLSDMASDAAGLLDALDIEAAHVVGMSMGGMIAQLVALNHRERVLSLCSVMSNTGSRTAGKPSAAVLAAVARRREYRRDEALQATMDLFNLIGGADWDPDEHRIRSEASIARAYHPDGMLRQSIAIAATSDRTRRLASLDLPTLVVHGLDDNLVRPSGGIATARAIRRCRLLMFPGMGHDLPATRHEEITDAILTNSRRADN